MMESSAGSAPASAGPGRCVVSAERAGVAQIVGRLRATRSVGAASDAPGAYRRLTIDIPSQARLAQVARPGQFAALAVGGPTSSTLLRRAVSIHRVRSGVRPDADVDILGGDAADQLDLVVAAHGAGTRWLTSAPVGTPVDVVAPLGRPFPLPTEPIPCVLVGGGYGSAPLFWLAETLRERGCRVDMVLGAATRDRLYGVDRAEGCAEQVYVTTDDGSTGTKGWVSDLLPEAIAAAGAMVVYACGPMAMLRSVHEIAAAHGIVAQVAVEEAMACGVGICMTCVMPVADASGAVKMARSCVDGPTFRSDRIVWDAFRDGRIDVPDHAVGAPRPGGH